MDLGVWFLYSFAFLFLLHGVVEHFIHTVLFVPLFNPLPINQNINRYYHFISHKPIFYTIHIYTGTNQINQDKNRSPPPPHVNPPRLFPLAHTLHATAPTASSPTSPPPPPPPPIHELSASTTAVASARGTRTQTIFSWLALLLLLLPSPAVSSPGVVILIISSGMAVPVRPRNWDSAEVRCVRAVRGSRGWDLVALEVLGWWVL